MEKKHILFLVMICVVLLLLPSTAFALSELEGGLKKVLKILTGKEAIILAGIAVAALGFTALFGRISWYFAGSVILGIVIIFGATEIVDYFT